MDYTAPSINVYTSVAGALIDFPGLDQSIAPTRGPDRGTKVGCSGRATRPIFWKVGEVTEDDGEPLKKRFFRGTLQS